MLVRDVMTEDPAYVLGSDTVSTAIDLLNEMDVRHLPVLEVEGGDVVGMISDRDLRSFEYPILQGSEEDGEFRDPLVSTVMSSDCYTVGPEDDLSEIIRLMIDQKCGAVPVVDPIEGELVGIVSYIDILIACEELLEY